MNGHGVGVGGDDTRPVRRDVQELITRALARAVDEDALPAPAEPFGIEVTRPADARHGDYTSNLAMKLARPLRRPPLAIAAAVAERIGAVAAAAVEPLAERVEVAPPGFLNLRLSPARLELVIDRARDLGPRYGRVPALHPERINAEFVSANPTGPLHIGNARGAFVGDLLCRVLEAGGHDVTREYYFNDFGSQVRLLGASVRAVANGEPVPQDGYRGDYVRELAADLPADLRTAVEGRPDADRVVGEWASERIRAGIEASLARLGVRFDVWKTEGSLHRDGWVERGIRRLAESGHTYEAEGALWFRSTAFGDDKDRVIRRSDGTYTYFGSDIAYLLEKFDRGFDRLVYIWGADHHGTVARLRNAAQAMGFERDRVEVLLTAWVRFIRDGEEISMSKRSGEFVTLDELLAEIGADAARWSFAARSATSGIDFDVELAKRQSSENPVYYVQYAHARISSILRRAAASGIRPAESVRGSLADDPVALGLARMVLRLPEAFEDALAARETHGLTAYAMELATTFHAFYRDRRVVDPADEATSGARLALVDATRLCLANTLGLLGISAPESM